jgi:hypothetical protein
MKEAAQLLSDMLAANIIKDYAVFAVGVEDV